MAMNSLGVFDIDGTIRIDGEIPAEVISGFEHLYANNVLTTLVTARGYRRVLEGVSSPLIPKVITAGLLATENGGRISNTVGDRNLSYHPLARGDLTAMLGVLPFSALDFLVFYPELPDSRPIMWSTSTEVGEKVAAKYGNFADIHVTPVGELETMLVASSPCMVSVKLNGIDLDTIASQYPQNQVTQSEGILYFNAPGINKSTAVCDMASQLNIPLSKVLVAGNDGNDIPMFENPEIGQKIWVMGGGVSVPTGLTHIVESPHALGTHLKSLRFD